MTFTQLPIHGARLVDLSPRVDDRGLFARMWCEEEFGAHGLSVNFVQCNTNFSHRAGTMRGLHYQTDPHGEIKLVRCIRGAVFDVIVDMRRESSTFMRWHGVELSEDNRRLLYVPAGCAHGFQTLRDQSEVLYAVSHPYTPSAERGVRWDDPLVGIDWPHAAERFLSPKDQTWPDIESVVR